jgi:hypothetical protein
MQEQNTLYVADDVFVRSQNVLFPITHKFVVKQRINLNDTITDITARTAPDDSPALIYSVGVSNGVANVYHIAPQIVNRSGWTYDFSINGVKSAAIEFNGYWRIMGGRRIFTTDALPSIFFTDNSGTLFYQYFSDISSRRVIAENVESVAALRAWLYQEPRWLEQEHFHIDTSNNAGTIVPIVSPDGQHIAMSRSVHIFSRGDSGLFTRFADSGWAHANMYGGGFSKNNDWLFLYYAGTTSGDLRFRTFNPETRRSESIIFTDTSGIGAFQYLPLTNRVMCASLNNDGLNFISVFECDGASAVKSIVPIDAAPDRAFATGCMAVSPDENEIILAGFASNAVNLYIRSGGTYIKSNLPNMPTERIFSCGITPNGQWLFLRASARLYVYRKVSGVWQFSENFVSINGNLQTTGGTFTATTFSTCHLTADSQTAVFASNAALSWSNHANLDCFRLYNDRWVKCLSQIETPSSSSRTNLRGVQITPDGSWLFATTNGGNWTGSLPERARMVFCLPVQQTVIVFDRGIIPAPADEVTASYFVRGIHKTANYVMDVTLQYTFGEGSP